MSGNIYDLYLECIELQNWFSHDLGFLKHNQVIAKTVP
jgi:hypothetical protein